MLAPRSSPASTEGENELPPEETPAPLPSCHLRLYAGEMINSSWQPLVLCVQEHLKTFMTEDQSTM